MSRPEHDRGLRTVARVREVRERDSRIGLVAALATVRERETALRLREDALAAAAAAPATTMADYVLTRNSLNAMALGVREAGRSVEAGRTVAVDAHARWTHDRSRLEAVTRLLERRAERRREELARAEVRELDDIVGRLWTRSQAEAQSARALPISGSSAQGVVS